MSDDLNEQLLRAVELGDLATAEELLNHGADVNASSSKPSENGYTPLHYAAAKGNESLVKLLLSNGAKINATALKKITPLYLATENSQIKVVKLLLENGANVNTCNENGKSVLYLAVESANLAMTEEILRFCPEINNEANRKSIYAPFETYVAEKFKKPVDALLRYGFTVTVEEAKDTVLLNKAFARGFVKMVEAFLKLGADVNTLCKVDNDNTRNRTLLIRGVFCRKVELVELLLNYGADANAVDSRGHSALYVAIKRRDVKMMKFLLQHSASFRVTTDDLHAAVQESRELVESLLKITPNIDVNACDHLGLTALHATVTKEMPYRSCKWFPSHVDQSNPFNVREVDASEIAQILLSRGAHVNANDTQNGATPLHLAAMRGYVKFVEVLLENEADIESLTKDDRTPLHFAATSYDLHDNVTIVKILLDNGANIRARDKQGMTALHHASHEGQKETLKLLIERGADINARDIKGLSPLHLAAMHGDENIVLTLLEHGANVEAKDKYNRTPLHLVGSYDGPGITITLLKAGADFNATCANSMTPLDYAINEINKFLEENRALGLVNDENQYFGPYPCMHEEIADILRKCIVASKALFGLYVSNKNDADRLFYESCQKETEIMKIKKIGDSDVTFYDFLTRGWDQLVNYGRNKSIMKAMESTGFCEEFPTYCPMIKLRCRQGLERESLLDSSLKSFNALYGYVVPDLPLMEIFNYLSNNDLENLIKADSDN